MKIPALDQATRQQIRRRIRAALICQCGHSKREHDAAGCAVCSDEGHQSVIGYDSPLRPRWAFCARFEFSRYFYAGPWPLRMAAERDRQVINSNAAYYLEMTAQDRRRRSERTFEVRP